MKAFLNNLKAFVDVLAPTDNIKSRDANESKKFLNGHLKTFGIARLGLGAGVEPCPVGLTPVPWEELSLIHISEPTRPY